MKVSQTGFKGLLVIENDVFGDHRGWFTETYSKKKYKDFGIDMEFVQDNQSYSAQKGTLRGIHFQTNPMAQTKLIRCTLGSITDTVVDLRKGSDTYKQWFSIELSAENKKQLLIPKGFGHAFVTNTPDVEVQYKVDEYYSKEHDRSILFNDPEIGINWGIENPILSEKDLKAPFLKDSDANFSIRVLVTGIKGQLGHDVMNVLKLRGIDAVGADVEQFDLTDSDATKKFVYLVNPDVVVHCAAYTAVDKAEEEQELTSKINEYGTLTLVKICKEIDAKLVYISTDYVFNDSGCHEITEESDIDPINHYGYSKAMGEKAVIEFLEQYFIIRTSWVYGKNGNNFVKTMLRLAESRDRISVVNDQIGSPTYTKDLAVLIVDMLQTRKYGIYHATNEGFCSWAEFATEIMKLSGKNTVIKPITTSEYPTKAKRPMNSRLSKKNLDSNGFKRLPTWQDALTRYLDEIKD